MPADMSNYDEDGNYVVYFSPEISGAREKEICAWVASHSTSARLSDYRPFIEFDDEELALLFRLKFGL